MSEVLDKLAALRKNLPYACSQLYKVRNKAGKLVTFNMNAAQLYAHSKFEEQKRRTGFVRALVLKGRQQGLSTYVAARFYHTTSMYSGVNTYILAHEQTASETLFGIVERYHINNPFGPHVGASNAKELEFDKLDSSYTVATAGQKAGGRSKALTLFHGCLSPDSFIVEPSRNARRMGDFKVGDLVRTHTGAVAPVSFISHRAKPTLRFKVQGVNVPMVATPEHRFLTRNGKVKLADLREGDAISYPITPIGTTPPSWPYRKESEWRAQGGGTQAVGPKQVDGTYAVGRVLGLFLAEGTVNKQTKSGAPAGITFTIHEREVERTLDWLRPLRDGWRSEPSVQRRKNSKTCVVVVNSRSLAEFVLARCGELDDKHVPSDWFHHADFARGLLHGYLAGDGHSAKREYNRRISAPSIRSAITFGMRDIAASLGYGWASVTYREDAVRNGRNEKAQWTFRLEGIGVDRLCEEIGWSMPERRRVGHSKVVIEDGFAHIPIQKIEDNGVCDVMDFEVDHPDHSYLTWQGASANSEVAFWPNAPEHFAASVQGVPLEPGTEVILESTSAGAGGEFYERVQDAVAGKGDYIVVFLPWWLSTEYARDPEPGFTLSEEEEDGGMSEKEYAETYGLSLRQMAWRRSKIIELRDPLLFQREYPATIAEAWTAPPGHEPYISSLAVVRARKRKNVEGVGPLIIGVDPASGGGDRFAVCWRRGLRIEKIEFRRKIDILEAFAWIRDIIEKDRPARVNVDAGNIGADLITLLKGHSDAFAKIVRGIDFGGTSQAKLARPKVPGPKNRRAEMYKRLKEWLELPEGVGIPDSEALQADLTALKQIARLDNDFLLESKVDMKRRGVGSTDLSDSAALTFASTEYFTHYYDPHMPNKYGDLSPVQPIEPEPDTGAGSNSSYGWMGY